LEYDSLDESFKLEVLDGYGVKKYSKILNSKISNCEFVDFPRGCRSSDAPQNPFRVGTIPQESVIFEGKFFTPFQLKFSFDDREWYIAVDTNTQAHIYEQKQ
jgi:hypothetical protein